MPNIIPKLNLNKTPNLVENNSLVFAKNIRLDVDGTIHRDYGIKSLCSEGDETIFDRIYRECVTDLSNAWDFSFEDIYVVPDHTFTIVGHIEDNTSFYLFIYGSYGDNSDSFIVRYDEKDDEFYKVDCAWNWSGGEIIGKVIKNLRGETILIIAEDGKDKLIPIKSININISKRSDNENIYTQTPNVGLLNLNKIGTFSYSIPNGTYQFFARYKIKDNWYTSWFPVSIPCFAGNTNKSQTSQGTVKYINTKRSSDESFIFQLEVLNSNYNKFYESVQLGFIVANDDSTLARAWKHFDHNTTTIISFDYKDTDGEEIDINDLLTPTYQIYNVKNITLFKNKVYISNYKESNFDEDLQEYANKVAIDINNKIAESTYDGNRVSTITINGEKAIEAIHINNEFRTIYGEDGILDEFLNIESETINENTYYAIKQALLNNSVSQNWIYFTKYGIYFTSNFDVLDAVITEAKNFTETDDFKERYGLIDNDLYSYTVNKNAISDYKDIKVIDINYNGYYYNTSNRDKTEIVGHKSIPEPYNGDADIVNNCLKTITEYIKNKSLYLLPKSASAADGYIIDDSGNIIESIDIVLSRRMIVPYTINDLTYPEYSGSGNVTTYYYEQKITIKLLYKRTYIDTDTNLITDYSTLIPYQKYKFYIHFVKNTGEVTNGYYCNGSNAGILEVPYSKQVNSIWYPIFYNIEIPQDYEYCFFSIVHVENDICTVYNIEKYSNIYEASLLEANLGLLSVGDNISLLNGNNDITYNANFYYSSDINKNRYYGADGILTFYSDEEYEDLDVLYVKRNYIISDNKDIELIKCTNYITSNTLSANNNVYADYSNMNLLGYICKIYNLNRSWGTLYFTDGSSTVFDKGSDFDDWEEVGVNLRESKLTLNYIYSNYNLNYLELSEEPKVVFKTSGSTTIVNRLFSSVLLSSVYKLPDMYKTYMQKTYITYNDLSISEFNNTIRSSLTIEDETSTNIILFEANDYYNTPVDKGIITNLISVGDSIIVHTHDSMFRFSGSNTLQSSDGNVSQVESQPFDTGIVEIFGSDFGFAGLQDKKHYIVTELGYIFFDSDSNIVYMYSGQSQLVKLSDTIEKLFRHAKITDCYFANDYYNNRIFLCIKFNKGFPSNQSYYATLSFSIIDSIKAFVSLHDFCFSEAFNTKNICYFLNENKNNVYTIDKNNYADYNNLRITTDFLYPLSVNKDDNDNIINYDSIIEVIVNTNFENIKTLNSISWCSNIIDKEFDTSSINSLRKVAEAIINKDIPCKAIWIYTDSCSSPLLSFTHSSTGEGVELSEAYKYPRWNQGFWTFNYFRNIENSNNSEYISDINSLIEGKYFVIRFYFDKEFKLETLQLNYNTKI